MARMIPSAINLNYNYLFDKIEKENIEGWTIFHSINHKNIFEIKSNDLIVITPEYGVYLVKIIEGGIEYNPFKDEYYDDNKKVISNPFLEIESEKHAFNKFYKENGFKKTLIGFGVAFVDIRVSIDSVEVDKRRIFDINKKSFKNYIKNLFELTKKIKINESHKSSVDFDCSLSNDDIESITSYLEKKLNVFESCKDYGKTFELTIEQKELRDVLENDVDRAIVHGAAGTGKTELALHIAMDMCKQNYSTIFFTNNMGAAENAKKFISIYGKDCDNLKCAPFQEYLIEFCKQVGTVPKDEYPYKYPRAKKNEFYDKILPKKVLEAFSIIDDKKLDDLRPKYDVVVMDQAQDLTQPNNLMAISLFLKKRMNRGRWYLFGDFLNQLLFRRSVYEDKILQYLEALSCDEKPYDKELEYNCRSSVSIVEELNKLTGMKVIAKNLDRIGKMEYILTTKDEEYVEKLDLLLDDLIVNRKINPSEITIIGTRKIEESPIHSSKYRNIIFDGECDDKTKSEGKVIHTRVFLYKGLENNYIIIYDLNGDKKKDDTKQGDERTSYRITMLYTGISRGKNEVYVLENEYDLNIRKKCYYAIEKNQK